MPNSLDVRTTAWEDLCCLDIGFRHMMPPWLGAIVTLFLLGTASGVCFVFFECLILNRLGDFKKILKVLVELSI